MTAHNIGTDREADEIILAILHSRDRDYSSSHISEMFGLTSGEYVRILTNRIRDADLAASKGADRKHAKRFWKVK